MSIIASTLLFLLLQTTFTNQKKTYEINWPDFSCYPSAKHPEWGGDDYFSFCKEENRKSWDLAPKANCKNSCILLALGIIHKMTYDGEPLEINSQISSVWRVVRDQNAGREIDEKIFKKCSPEAQLINSKKWNCNEWGHLYKCIDKAVQCGPEPIEIEWPNFDCYPKSKNPWWYEHEIFEGCKEEYRRYYWAYSERTNCMKSCMLKTFNIIDFKSDLLEMKQPKDMRLWMGVKDEKIAEVLANKIYDACKGEVDKINETKSHCDEWGDLFFCIGTEVVKCHT